MVALQHEATRISELTVKMVDAIINQALPELFSGAGTCAITRSTRIQSAPCNFHCYDHDVTALFCADPCGRCRRTHGARYSQAIPSDCRQADAAACARYLCRHAIDCAYLCGDRKSGV